MRSNRRFLPRCGAAASMAAAIVILLLLPASAARAAGATRTFVSGHGTDSGSCAVTAPCRSFAYAITQTAPNGEITVLDSAGYGAVTITQSVTITSPTGIEGAITTTNAETTAIAISGNVDVTIRGLTIIDSSGGTSGISFSGSGNLLIADCLIIGFTGNSVNFTPTQNSTLEVSDTIAYGDMYSGFNLAPTGGTTVASFERVQTMLNGFAGFATGNETGGTVYATASDCTAVKNDTGFWIADGTFAIGNSRITGNTIGVNSYQAGVVVSLANTTLAGNGTGYYVSEGAIHSFGNNYILDTSNTGSLTKVSQQ